ncbi:Mur ligase domain-containing protein, partial [Arthrospira platensis SPKY1]|nr:Mur ligase domain-containing protein [Arthrospira platensis SPKY1]
MAAIETLYQHYLAHPLISTDSRNIPPGCLFFALKGERFDGNAFAPAALEAGATLAVVDDPVLEGKPGMFRVDKVL